MEVIVSRFCAKCGKRKVDKFCPDCDSTVAKAYDAPVQMPIDAKPCPTCDAPMRRVGQEDQCSKCGYASGGE